MTGRNPVRKTGPVPRETSPQRAFIRLVSWIQKAHADIITGIRAIGKNHHGTIALSVHPHEGVKPAGQAAMIDHFV